MAVCFEIASVIELAIQQEKSMKLVNFFERTRPDISHFDSRIRFLKSFDDAMSEVSLITHIPENAINGMIEEIREAQYKALRALAQATTGEFASTMGHTSQAERLRLIGYNVSALRLPQPESLDRDRLYSAITDWIDLLASFDMSPLERTVLTLQLNAVRRFLTECRSATDDQVRVVLKSLKVDLQESLERAEKKHRTLIESMISAISEPLRAGRFAISLASEMATVATFAGGIIAVAITPPAETKLLLADPRNNPQQVSDEP